MNKINKKYLYIALCPILILIGFFGGYYVSKKTGVVQYVREKDSNYSFIDPLLFTKVPEEISYPEYNGLKESMQEFVDTNLKNKKTEEISAYFRNLNTSQWVSINSDARFFPASMLKVVTLISVLRKADIDPTFLKKEITLTGGDEEHRKMQSIYTPKDPIISGRTYTVQELVDHLIQESDNVANAGLNNLIGEEGIKKTYKDLELPIPDESGEKSYTTTEYSRFYRILYNGTYLSKKSSEKALKLLSETTFNSGLVAGVPENITISHKFGVHTTINEDIDGIQYRELHDCGIVYYPDHPYFVCIMTRGKNLEDLEKVIADGSKAVWNYISQKYKSQ